VELEPVGDEAHADELFELIQKHYDYTNSARAKEVLARWDESLAEFVQVFPLDYKRALAGIEFGDKDY
jgi:glutamate synthase domain-containing protein 3